jgi:peroxiredoxin
MKNILIIITFISLFSLTINAQEKMLYFYGQILNSSFDTITLSNHYGQYIAVTNANGEFRFEEELANPDFLNLNIKDYNLTLFLFAGDTLEMNSNLNDFSNSINFKGKRAEFNKNLASLSSGHEAPQFSLKNVNGELVDLSEFKGKYVYIDVWNSSCRPCFKEFPKMEELIEKYHDKNIVFVGISLDRNEDVWKKTIERKDIKGVQLFGEGWKSEFAKDYSIIFNPRFILIDKNQNILYLSAPRPTGNIEKILNQFSDL